MYCKTLLLFIIIGVSSLKAQTLTQNYFPADYSVDSIFQSLVNDSLVLEQYEKRELSRYYMDNPFLLVKIDFDYHHSFVINYTDPDIQNSSLQNDFIGQLNITKYQHKRKQSDRVTVNFEKYGIQVELLSVDEVNTLTEQLEIESQNYTLTSFPEKYNNPDYEQEKSTWVQNHNDLYSDLLSDSYKEKVTITQDEYDALPQAKRDYIDAHSEKYIVR